MSATECPLSPTTTRRAARRPRPGHHWPRAPPVRSARRPTRPRSTTPGGLVRLRQLRRVSRLGWITRRRGSVHDPGGGRLASHHEDDRGDGADDIHGAGDGDGRGRVAEEAGQGLRPGELRLSADDEQVLRIVGPLLAQTLRARALASDLQESRAAAISTIEEERRHVRRDLHDGLGPTLSGIARTGRGGPQQHHLGPGWRRRAAPPAPIGCGDRGRGDPPARVRHAPAGAGRARSGGRAAPAVQRNPNARGPADARGGRSGRPTAAAGVGQGSRPTASPPRRSRTRPGTAAPTTPGSSSGRDRDHLEVTVRDNGSSAGTWVPGVGLSSIRQRASEVGGTVDITANGHGSEVRALLPLG